MKYIITLLTFTTLLFAKTPPAKKINWISFEKAIELNKTNPKPILIDIYTDWCTWCHKMDETTYSDPEIVKNINTNFYAVKLNAEQKETIKFNGKTYKYIANGRRGYHELAYALLQGKLSFPSTVFMTPKTEVIQVIPGYIDTKEMEKISVYMGEKKYLSTEWNKFEAAFKSKIK